MSTMLKVTKGWILKGKGMCLGWSWEMKAKMYWKFESLREDEQWWTVLGVSVSLREKRGFKVNESNG